MNMSEKFKRGGVDLVSLDEHQDELEPPYCSHGKIICGHISAFTRNVFQVCLFLKILQGQH